MLELENGYSIPLRHITKIGPLEENGTYEIVLSDNDSEHIAESHKSRASLIAEIEAL